MAYRALTYTLGSCKTDLILNVANTVIYEQYLEYPLKAVIKYDYMFIY